MILFAALEGHELALSHFRQHALPFFQSLEKYIRRRQAAGALRKIKPECILLAAFSMAHQYAQDTQMFGFPRFASDEGVVEAFVRLIESPAGERPFRTVPTAAIEPLLRPYNALADTMRDTLARMFKVPELTVLQEGALTGV